MIYRRYLLFLIFLFSPFFLLMQTSCEKFSGDQTIPAYLSIDSIFLQTDFGQEGTASHNITDAWVYVDDYLVGTFQMPARFPVLYKGIHDLTIIPGIKRNGIATTRVTYPFYNSITKSVNFTPDSTVSVGIIKTTYFSTTKFAWKEAFEDVSLSIDTTHQSKVELVLTPSGNDTLTFEGLHSGMIQMNDTNNFFEIVTHSYFPIPSAPVYLEMNFNTNTKFQAGVFIYTSDYIVYQAPILNLAPTNDKWKKIYIDLTTTLNSYLNSTSFKVFLGGFKDSGIDNATVLIDNLKIVTR
jgi:hypothetical protein